MPIDLGNLEQYGLFNVFWNTHGDPDLSGGGLNEITPRGAEKLYEYAKRHELRGDVSADAYQVVDTDEKDFIKALLEHPRYGAFFELDGKVKLMDLFGIRPEDIHSHGAVRPKDEGEVNLPTRVSLMPEGRLANVDVRQLPNLMKREYDENRRLFEGSDLSVEERGLNTLGLLRDYAKALWARGEQPLTEQVGHQLLDTFGQFRNASLIGSKNFNGAPWSAAQGLVLGVDPNVFETSFPKAHSDADSTHLSMNGAMAGPMAHVDRYLAKLGKPTGAEAFENASPLGWLIGEPSGHNKRGNLTELRPFSTSGLNWGIALFPGDAEVKNAKLKQGFDFAIDCVDGLGNFVTANPQRGEKLIVTDAAGERLTAEKVIETNAEGESVWSARFSRADGTEVPASEVVGRAVDARGQLKGDGRTGGQVNMWWWGFCDRNTAQRLYKAKFEIPQLDVPVVKVRAGGETLEIPGEDAQKLIDVDIPDVAAHGNFCGFRFNNEPQQILLKDGRRIMGRVAPEVLASIPSRQRLSADVMSLRNSDEKPMLGSLEMSVGGMSESLPAANVVSMERDESTGEVTVHLDRGWRDTVKGVLNTEVPWARGETVDGKTVLKQTDDKLIRGDLAIDTGRAGKEHVPAADVDSIVGEMQTDQRLSQWVAWVSKQHGMYASDSVPSEVVSNGMRWVNLIDQEVHGVDASDRPEWAPQGDLQGINGPFDPAPDGGDSLVWVRGKYGYDADSPPNSTAWSGWIQLNKQGRILNEGFVSGESDFGWSADGPLNWSAPSSFNPTMDPGLRVALVVNGLTDLRTDNENTERLAKTLNLPADWRTLRA
ncbi:MAG: hypothetical protein H6729_00480 [Deltaproteobacteria bacterium]|nr:hypothetical protein [Deltaproteobacteria bacterium]